MGSRIEEIRLDGLLPAVFAGEEGAHSGSGIWLCDAAFRRGEKVLVEAESGAGKSSMCAYIYGSRTDFIGTLTFNGRNVAELAPGEWQRMRRVSLAYLPQELSLFPELSAWDNIRLKNDLTGHADASRIEGWMRKLGILFRRDFPAGKMSIGQQQRLAIVRALCQPFDFILLDEPVSHLDSENNRIAAAIIAEEAERQGAGIISTSVGNHLALNYDRTIKL